MELTNEFKVGIPVAEAWAVLTDVERIAPCMPGAQLREIEGDEYRGAVKVKVGPITAEYRGKATFVEMDPSARRAVLRAEGRETRGQGNASATITAQLEPDSEGTRVKVTTDLAVTGKVAQFGRGVLADVSSKLLSQFVSCLESEVLTGPPAGAGAAPEGGGSQPAAAQAAEPAGARPPEPGERGGGSVGSGAGGVRLLERSEAEPVDLLDVAGGSVVRRFAPALAGLTVMAGVVAWVLRRRRR